MSSTTNPSGGLPVNSKYMLGLLSEISISFINWSLVVEYIAIIWFYPMGFMGFTGMEAFLVLFFTPLLLGVGFIRSLTGKLSPYIRLVAQLLAMYALYPYDLVGDIEKHEIVFHNPHVFKTVLVGAAIAFDWLCQCRTFIASVSQPRRDRTAFAYALGIVLHALIRLPYLSVNPFVVWKEWIIFGSVLIVLSSVYLIFEQSDSSTASEESSRRRPLLEDGNNPWSTGIGFGGLVFGCQFLISTYGLIPRWVNLGPYPAGIVVIGAMMAGIILNKKRSLVTSRNYLAFALVCGVLFGWMSGSVPTIVGLGGLVTGSLVGTFLMSLWVVMLEKISNTTKLFRMFLAFVLSYTVLLFWAIYVVSYKFVPWWLGSTLLRERHQTLVLAIIISVAVGVYDWSRSTSADSSKKHHTRGGNTMGVSTLPQREVFYVLFAIFLLLILFSVNRNLSHPTQANVAGNHYETHATHTTVENIAPKEIKSMIWTIHFGYDNYGRNSFPNITDAIKSHGVNVIGLLESDLSRVMTANRDLVEWLASELHMHSDFGPAPSENTWGCALLTVFPIKRSNHVILPSPEGELACLIDAVVEVDNTEVNIIVTHFGNTEDVLDRKLQSEGARDVVINNNGMPTVFLSYITEKTGGDNYKTIRSSGLEDTTDQRRYCEYIFYRGLEMNKFQRWPCGEISDTEGQIAYFTTKK